MRIEWHPLALSDFTDLIAYIASDNPQAAFRIHDEIRRRTGTLATHPEAGRRGRVPGTRELVIAGTPYIAAYRTSSEVVTILRVLHGARLWPPKL